MKFDKHTLGKRFSKFLSKMFWHFNQTVPNYSTINPHSIDKPPINPDRQKRSVIDAPRYRRQSSCQHTSTLMSIEEENEIELMNCK
jgi:hypothetical protein